MLINPKFLFLWGFLYITALPPLPSEILFTPRAQADPEGVQEVLASWAAHAAAEPTSPAVAWMKKQGEAGYIGDITVDFDNEYLREYGSLAAWRMDEKLFVLPTHLPEPYLSQVIAHEAGGHAYFDTKVHYIDRILPPRYAVAMTMIREVCGFLHEMKEAARHDDYAITETITERPPLEDDIVAYFYKLRKYIADTHPDLGEQAVWQAACNEFAMGLAANKFYLNYGIGSLWPQLYQLMDADRKAVDSLKANTKYYTTPVLNRGSSHYMASINLIMRKYLEAAMPPGVQLTLDVDLFLREVSRNIDIVDKERETKGQSTCAYFDGLLAQEVKHVESLGASVLDGGMIIKSDVIEWLDKLVGKPSIISPVVQTIRATSLYNGRL